MALIDNEQRQQATSPHASYIVQAPAGSGKTEILTQRYLRLLSTVSAPEQIIALTFTRKAANEMRERIMLALQQAATNLPAQSTHQKTTLRFAKEALSQDAQLQWNLLQHPNRLRVITIDSLCQSINQAIPLLEQQIAYANITDKAEGYYLKAARACIEFALHTPEYQAAIKTLLLHVDNKQALLVGLFKSLLAQRDQWLNPLFEAKEQDKQEFEHALQFIEQHELERLRKSLPRELAYQLVTLVNELVQIENNPESPRALLDNFHEFSQITPELAKALGYALLGSDSNLRKGFDHHVGLKSGSCSPAQYKQLKDASKELLYQLTHYPDFHTALLKVGQLPKPEYDAEQWDVLQALFLLLPILVGHLHLLFVEHNEVDFTIIAQQALTALGDEDNPTDLALYLDNTVQHLLVDEFQDTSITQFQLLTQLVQGWQIGDGRTLFIVGDPMQSIYRFRQAEVGLFYRAKNQGVGPVDLTFLELKCNFRSTATIVDWINVHFSEVFPREVDMESGAVSFHPSVHVINAEPNSAVYAIECQDKKQEAIYLVEKICYELETNSEQSIAILVRSRSHLPALIQLLREQKIPYQGTDIDLLAHLLHLRDVWSITQALLMPGNRLVWLAALRSPYCGLNLNDLHIIAQYNKKHSIYSCLLSVDKIIGLSEEGRIRAGFFINVMSNALLQRCQTHVADWIITTLKQLNIDAILTKEQLDDLEQFWSLLDKYDHLGRLSNIDEFEVDLNRLYSQQSIASRLQIMTIHKSKGLEFDTVFLPNLGAQPNRGDSPLLRWLKLPSQEQDIMLVSPMKGAHQEQCALYDYLSDLDAEKSHYESQRLLYVAATRAKFRLYLLDSSSRPAKKSFRGLLAKQAFEAYQPQEENLKIESDGINLLRLPLTYFQKTPNSNQDQLNSMSEMSESIPRLIGIVAHRLLQWICEYHPNSINEVPWSYAEHELRQLGFDKQSIRNALELIKNQFVQFFQDPIGLWLIACHQQEQNEYELLIQRDNNLLTRIIDRTFAEDGYLWIIDFKTGKESVEAQIKYQQQLNEYAQLMASFSNLPIRCGIYYLSNNHWVHWHYEKSTVEENNLYQLP